VHLEAVGPQTLLHKILVRGEACGQENNSIPQKMQHLALEE